MRKNNRDIDALRDIGIETGISCHAEGSCLCSFGNTRVFCTASWQHGVPTWMRGRGSGWISAEYGMLPRATHSRNRREVTQGHPSGRSQEIQRLIGRALRSVTNMRLLGENQIIIDCDVLQADGGTRTAAITGGWIALKLACRTMRRKRALERDPVTGQVAAISCGVTAGLTLLDLDYDEDSNAEIDANFVMESGGDVIEIQSTGEKRPFAWSEFEALSGLARKGCGELFALQRQALD